MEQLQELINKKNTFVEIGEVKGILQRKKAELKGENF